MTNKKGTGLPLKTRFFNVFRLAFIFYPLEKLLRYLIVDCKLEFLRKLIPLPQLYKPGTFRISEKDGVQFYLDLHQSVDHFIYWLYHEKSYNRLLELASKANIIFDVGANVGSTALGMAKVNPQAVIHAFEPHQGNYAKALKNLSMNNFSNVFIHPFGLGQKTEKKKLYEVMDENSGMNRILNQDADFPFTEIEIKTLDDFVSESGIARIDLIKIDVEGFEMYVLYGAKNALRSFPVLFVELDDNNLRLHGFNASMMIKFLKDAGYNRFYRADLNSPVNEETNFTNCHFDLIAEKIS